ncbi:putative LRR receptor-like serine/threonine-protein kinase RKF3 [Capsicum galapagoense]
MSQILYVFLFLHVSFPRFSATTYTSSSSHRTPASKNSSSSLCPLDFDAFRKMIDRSNEYVTMNVTTQCHYIRQGIRLLQSDYLRRTNYSFLPPLKSVESCWSTYENLVDDFIPKFNISSSCGFNATLWSSPRCMNITSRTEFESRLSPVALSDLISSCNRSLENSSPCGTCITGISNLLASLSNADCTGSAFIYTAAFANHFGPTNRDTARCLFASDITAATYSNQSNTSKKNFSTIIVIAVVVCGLLFIILSMFGYWFSLRRNKLSCKWENIRFDSNLGSMRGTTTLVRFTFDEIKSATRNFSRENIIGLGGYGNVYKGVLTSGCEVALKRFKNCSAGGDSSFIHELEVIASVRHVNLLGLRGYCTATFPLEGHQRIIVCDLVKHGSLYDHLFGLRCNKLSWPIRQRIAIGTARGLAYLHYGAQPAIIHRDIKSSNILLDENFEPKVADFGLAKFNPEGMTHLSTRVAGTMGYVAPEYALYGQLTERSDVYSFGVVLLELLSGKKALIAVNDGKPTLVTDWAWSLVREGRPLDVVEENTPDLDHPEILEKYVMVAVLCSHPQLYARPTMDQVVKMLEADIPVPVIPERPISLIADLDDIERSINSSNGSGYMSTSTGYQLYNFEHNGTPGR